MTKTRKHGNPEKAWASRKKQTYEIQAMRARHFPKNRIPFLSSATKAQNDIETFKKYQSGAITVDDACKMIANNNCLEEVTHEQFYWIYHANGYDQRSYYE